ncbi:related to peroxisomal short-chain alcohol dehydrogenase [Phialocephala subalpina]|uniref:Related to peroxisomal short-chain alcohol dehydrogenase n=1 Tax=Phialocephala subalpina TaxID=576137 RepID=A0A1L7XX86_9HELO|nr:related to peroxisomal short-chain alcohol dehydrogenase [Phialocephala subalpina]
MASSKPDFLPTFTSTWHTSPPSSISPLRPELSAKGKSVVVTGGGTGIGASVALSFAQAGPSFIGLTARREDKLLSSKAAIEKAAPGVKVGIAAGDISDIKGLTEAFGKLAKEAGGKLDVLVSSAGYLNEPSSIMEGDPEDWWKVQEIVIRGTYNTIRAFVPLASSSAIFLNITSGIGHMPVHLAGLAGTMSAYAVSKIANGKLVEYAAAELKDRGIRAVNIQPGVVTTDLNMKHGAIAGLDTSDLPGNFCVWLASPEAEFLNGRYVYVNWDVDELKAKKEEILKDPKLLTLGLEGPVY